MKSVTVKQIQRLDRMAIDKISVPSIALMENAGRAVASDVYARLCKSKSKAVSVFCGLGNNAGDGFVVARHLINWGIKTNIFLIGQAHKLKKDAAINYNILKRLKYPIQEIKKSTPSVIRTIKNSGVVVDALFGVGLNREVCEPFKGIIEALNTYSPKIVAVDIPSGLDGTSGKVYGVCVKATATVTFSFAKKGFFVGQGPRHTGKVVVVDIGIPQKLKKCI